MRFAQFIAEGDVVDTPLSAEEAIDWMKRYSTRYLARLASEATPVLYRGDSTAPGGAIALARDSNAFARPRRSANTSNYYTLWIDNHKSWEKYPRRSRSFICSTSHGYASGYGDKVFIVIPMDNALVGICPEMDIWGSFKLLSEVHVDLEWLVFKTRRLFAALDYDLGALEHDWKLLEKHLRETTVKTYTELNHAWGVDEDLERLERLLKKYGPSLYDVFEKILEPSENGFAAKIAAGMPMIAGSAEVWIQGKALFIDESKVTNDHVSAEIVPLKSFLHEIGVL